MQNYEQRQRTLTYPGVVSMLAYLNDNENIGENKKVAPI